MIKIHHYEKSQSYDISQHYKIKSHTMINNDNKADINRVSVQLTPGEFSKRLFRYFINISHKGQSAETLTSA